MSEHSTKPAAPCMEDIARAAWCARLALVDMTGWADPIPMARSELSGFEPVR